MPKVVRQRPKGRRVRKDDPRGRLQDLGSSDKGLKINIYGLGKRGKTRCACTFPKPLMLLGTEDGTNSLGPMKGVKFLAVESSQDIETFAEVAVEDGYKTVVLDTAGGLQDMILKEILGLEDVPVQKSWGIAKQQDWGTCGVQTKERLRTLLNLADKHGIHIPIIAHERDFSKGEEDTDLGVFPTVGSALTPSVANWLNGACDYICQCFLERRMEERRTKIGKKEVVKRRDTGKIDYCLRVGPHPVYMTGFRVSPGVKLPNRIVDPSYSKIVKVINGG